MQRGGADFVAKGQRLLAVAHPYRNRAVSISAIRFGGDHRVEFLRQGVGILNFTSLPSCALDQRPRTPDERYR